MAQYVMALDQGTTSSRTLIFDDTGRVVAQAAEVLPNYYPRSGWVEQRPAEIWQTQRTTIETALNRAGLAPGDVAALGTTNQRETTVAWNRETGEAVGDAIVWQDRRTADFCAELKAAGHEAMVSEKTGLLLDPYFSGTKLAWLLDNVDGARVAAEAGVGAEVLHFDADSGLMLTRYLDGCITMSPELFKSRPRAPARAAEVLKRMHGCGREFRFRFELFAMIDEYLGLLAKLEAPLPDGYHEVVTEAGAVRQALDATPATLVPCHCDPLSENFLDDGARMWIVDWEYSGMNDPLWDLGDLSVEAGFTPAQDYGINARLL